MPDRANCVLAALGLLHMWVKFVIPEELGGNYEPRVSRMCAFTFTCFRLALTLAGLFHFQMLWWGMDETLAEIFACHPVVDCFDGNPIDAFSTTISDLEYGPDEMPVTIGLYGGRYTIRFQPGESPASWELPTNLYVCTNAVHETSRDRLCVPEDIQ
jgi:hypothetical protein